MRLVVKRAGIRETLQFAGTVSLTKRVADDLADDVASAMGLPVVDQPFPESGGGDEPGAVRREDGAGRNRPYSHITVTHPNNKRRQQGREVLQSKASAFTDIDFDRTGIRKKGQP